MYYIRIQTSDFTYIHSYQLASSDSNNVLGKPQGDYIVWNNNSSVVCRTSAAEAPKCFRMQHDVERSINMIVTGSLFYFFDY